MKDKNDRQINTKQNYFVFQKSRQIGLDQKNNKCDPKKLQTILKNITLAKTKKK